MPPRGGTREDEHRRLPFIYFPSHHPFPPLSDFLKGRFFVEEAFVRNPEKMSFNHWILMIASGGVAGTPVHRG